MNFLTEVLPDKFVEMFLQTAVGYSLTGFTGEHCLFLLHGHGRNGKSVFINTIQYLLGDYAMQADWQSFSSRKSGQAEIREDIARLEGARFVAAIESEQNIRLAENVIKAITGGDRITARHLYKGSFEFYPQFKLWLATNHLPKIIGTDDGIWSRIMKIPFTVTIPKEKRDTGLTEKLKQEAPGILNWALAGLKTYLQTGLVAPEAVRKSTDVYRDESDVMNRFLVATCIFQDDAEVSTTTLYQRYRRWCDEVGETYVMSEHEFRQSLDVRGLQRQHKRAGAVWIGLALTQEPIKPGQYALN